MKKLLSSLLLALTLATLLTGPRAARAGATDLADAPLFSSVSVPGNLLLALSVEWPTASTPAYLNTVAYSAATTYVGYFDPEKCYRYQADATTPANSYFVPHGAASSHACTSTSTAALWSGNWLNWASTQTLDAFRWTLTGGTRMPAFDTATLTVLQKTYHNGSGGRSSIYPDKITANATSGTGTVSGATPFNWSHAVARIHGMGTAMIVSGNIDLRCSFTPDATNKNKITYACDGFAAGQQSCSATGNGNTCTMTNASPAYSVTCGMNSNDGNRTYTCTSSQASTTTCSVTVNHTNAANCRQADPTFTNYTGQSSAAGNADTSAYYRVYIQLKACDASVGLESNCVAYGSNYKPEGLMQKYAQKLRYSAFGYLNDSTITRDGGVMRARMKYIAPTQPVPGSAAIANAAAEWSSATGVMLTNPDATDAAATVTRALAETGLTVAITQSGVINYLNRFGLTALSYKSYDPVSELYYAGLRYFRNLGPVTSYSSFTGITNAGTLSSYIDGFPVITAWDDPIVYSCQKNFILGIGDINSHRDANLYGSTIRTADEPAMPAEVSADTAINVKTATDMVGQLEGLSSLGTYSSGRNNSFFIAGLAYDAHTRDQRSDLSGNQTVNTYWVDVLEGQSYTHRNQYWLAAKYGGFEVPLGFNPYAATNSTTTLPQSSWYTNTDTLPNGGTTNLRPDNYFTGGQADRMVSGLTRAFAKIAAEAAAATSTAFAGASLNEAMTGGATYAAGYDPKSWTGTLTGSSVSYAADGTPTITQAWNARDKLNAMTASQRRIVTCCTATGAGLPFTAASLGAQALSSRTTSWNTSFANVTGVASASQSASNYLDYLRGDRSREIANGGVYRTRSTLLGDIVNAKLTVVAAPQSPYYDVTNPGYQAFRRTYSGRRTVVYAGANDGMLHAFDGSLSGTTAGTELFAYIPSFVYRNGSDATVNGLAALGNPSYEHRYFVDASPQVYDVDFLRVPGITPAPAATASDWRSLLIGGLGKGGRGYYAIDVTSPTSWTDETAIAGKVLWEYTDATMGYSFGDARIVKTAKYGWTVVIPSGYGTPDGRGEIHLVNPKTGALLEKITLPGGSAAAPLDVAHVTAFIPDLTDYTATALYTGDMQGNVWRIDISGTGSYPTPLRFARLTDSTGTAQPVTSPVRVMIDPNTGKRYVMVGTGRLLADSDVLSSQTQSFYAFVDGTADQMYTTETLPSGASFPLGRSQMVNNTDLLTGIGSDPTPKMGWYVDLGRDTTTNVAERITVAPTVHNGLVGVAINRPNGDACSPSGSSKVMAVRFADGKSVLTDTSGTTVAMSAFANGIASDLTFKNIGGRVRLVAGRSSGTVSNLPGTFGAGAGLRRLNWREVPTSN
jgi:type IV pilus assembly protein PilY1